MTDPEDENGPIEHPPDEAMLASHLRPPPTPAQDDPDSWPDTVDEWLADIDARLRWDPSTTAADLRALYGGIDEELDPGEPGYWDPSTDSLDPAMEQALRIRGVPGALPAPEALPEATSSDPADADGADADLPRVPIDNRVAIEAPPEPSPAGCMRFLLSRSVAIGGLAALAALGLLLFVLLGPDDADDPSPTDDATDQGAEPEETETAGEVLRRATQALLDSRTAQIEQTFTVTSPQGETSVSATGVVDFEQSDAQSTISAGGSQFDTYLDEMIYLFDAGTGWVETMPGELNENEDAIRLGLNAYGLGEALNPIALAHLAATAEDVEDVGNGVVEGVTTLPVTGPGAAHVDHLTRAAYGHGQADLSGLGVRLRVEPTVESGTRITLTLVLDDGIPYLGDDPHAEGLRGITLTNRALFTELRTAVSLSARDADRTELLAFIKPPVVSP